MQNTFPFKPTNGSIVLFLKKVKETSGLIIPENQRPDDTENLYGKPLTIIEICDTVKQYKIGQKVYLKNGTQAMPIEFNKVMYAIVNFYDIVGIHKEETHTLFSTTKA